ncbi:hypothetical protein B0H19DRAFT_1062960 [Mycena capillaripes]|nr:hypothetical protein B0H19DRAFT_1062960 [Mycena capillaripes]
MHPPKIPNRNGGAFLVPTDGTTFEFYEKQEARGFTSVGGSNVVRSGGKWRETHASRSFAPHFRIFSLDIPPRGSSSSATKMKWKGGQCKYLLHRLTTRGNIPPCMVHGDSDSGMHSPKSGIRSLASILNASSERVQVRLSPSEHSKLTDPATAFPRNTEQNLDTRFVVAVGMMIIEEPHSPYRRPDGL